MLIDENSQVFSFRLESRLKMFGGMVRADFHNNHENERMIMFRVKYCLTQTSGGRFGWKLGNSFETKYRMVTAFLLLIAER